MASILILTLQLATILVVFLAYANGKCPDGWIVYAESCYKIVQRHETWFEANQVCKIYHSTLVELISSEENEFVKNWLKQRHASEGVWIGLSDLLVENKWIWTEDQSAPAYTDWAPQQPSGLDNDENCAVLWKGTDFKWHDDICHYQKQFICEKSRAEAPSIG